MQRLNTQLHPCPPESLVTNWKEPFTLSWSWLWLALVKKTPTLDSGLSHEPQAMNKKQSSSIMIRVTCGRDQIAWQA